MLLSLIKITSCLVASPVDLQEGRIKMWSKSALKVFCLLPFGLTASKIASPLSTLTIHNNFQALFFVLRQILFQRIHHGCEILYVYGFSNFDNLSFREFDTLELNQYSAGQRLLSLYTRNISYPRHEDTHRHTPGHCTVALLFFEEFTSPETLQPWLFDTITPRYGPVIKKDEDHFIFLTPTQSVAETAMLSRKFGEKVKYKIGLFQVTPTEVACTTIDFYAGAKGTPVFRLLETFPSNVSQISRYLFPDMTYDFNGHLFRITVPNVKYRFEMEWRDGGYHPKRGFYKWWLDEAILKFNFTYIMFWSSFGTATGKPLENGTWVGAAGDLLYDHADIAVIVGETYSRQPFFGFSSVLSYEWFFFMTHKPWNNYSPKAIFWPFSPLMWGLFFASLFLMTYCLRIISDLSSDPNCNTKEWTYGMMFRYIFTTFMEQDREGPVSSSSIRMLCAFWLLFALVTSTAYRGSLVNLIGFPIDSWIPSTFEELAYSDFGVALNNVGKVGAAYDMLSSSTNPVFKQLYEKMEMIAAPELCLFKAMKEDVGCIIWEGIVQYANARNVSDRFGYVPMVQSKEIALFIGDGFTYERRAIFKHHMDRTIEAALQMGLTIKWLDLDKKFIWKQRSLWEKENNRTEVYYDRDDGPRKLVMSQFEGLFWMCVVGLLLASAQFLWEQYKWKSFQKMKMDLEKATYHANNKNNTKVEPDEYKPPVMVIRLQNNDEVVFKPQENTLQTFDNTNVATVEVYDEKIDRGKSQHCN